MVDDIKKIITAGTQAPSGDNCQPWKFVVKDNIIKVYNVPERDQSVYNYRQRASYVAHGAALENISIASSALGYSAKIDVLLNNSNTNLVAAITLQKSAPNDEPLYPYIERRVSNRKPYKDIILTNEQISVLKTLENSAGDIAFKFAQDKDAILRLAEVGATNEQVMLENKILHDHFFNHVNWTKKQELTKRHGFYIKTLELPPPAVVGFKLFSYWKVLNVLNKIGASKSVVKQNTKTNAAASAIGVITSRGDKPLDFVNVGRKLERIWLAVTKLKLNMQPLAGMLFLVQSVSENNAMNLSQSHAELIKEKYNIVKNTFGITDETAVMMFRIGYGGEPSAKSERYNVDSVVGYG